MQDSRKPENAKIIQDKTLEDPETPFRAPSLNISGETSTDRVEELLGANPTIDNSFGPEIINNLAIRWQSYLTEGLDKETKSLILDKWKIPQNCVNLRAPTLNEEVAALLHANEIRKDGVFRALQSNLGKALGCLGNIITKNLQMSESQETSELIEMGKILCDLHHSLSNHRKYRLNGFLNEEFQKVAQKSKIDTLLFGSDFTEQCKTAKIVKTTSTELKPKTNNPRNNLNFKRTPFKSRFKELRNKEGGARSRFQAPNQKFKKYVTNKPTHRR